MSRVFLLFVVALSSLANGFKGMSNWKLPSLKGTLLELEAKEKFGDKKLVVITGTSSGLGRATARHLIRTGK